MSGMEDKIDWKKGDGLVPAIIQDSVSGKVLMLGYMNQELFEKTLATKQVTFFSRSRQQLWRKGETSGNVLHFKSWAVDCDGDLLLIIATPDGPTCHTGSESCFGSSISYDLAFLSELEKVIQERVKTGGGDSYVARLVNSGLPKMAQKVGEEGVETALAAILPSNEDFKNEAADLLFHLLILLQGKNISLSQIVGILQERHANQKK